MKRFASIFLGIIILMLITAMTFSTNESAATFEKTVFIEMDISTDSSLFAPYSKAWEELWSRYNTDVYFNESSVMNAEKYQLSFENRTENLWTILHPMIINGKLTPYSPYDPETFGLGALDDGELRFPIKGEEKKATFLNSESLRSELGYYLGILGPPTDIPLITIYGEDSVVYLPDGTMSVAYAPRDFEWYTDKDIIKYRMRVSVLTDKNGVEKKRIIRSIAPVVNMIYDGQIEGEKELLWLDFKELKSTLKKNYFFNSSGSPVSYLAYLKQAVHKK